VLQRSRAAQTGVDYALRYGAAASVTVGIVAVLVASVLLAVGRSLLTYGNLVLARRGDTLHLQHGLLRVREHTYDMRRLRGVTVRESLLVRVLGGARLDAVMTGVNGAGESSLLLPPCPAATAQRVLADLVVDISVEPSVASWVGTGPLRSHGSAAARRRWMRALLLPAVGVLALAVSAATIGVPVWVWPVWAAVAVGCALLAGDRIRSLGHRVAGGWLVAREGSVERRRDCIETAGVIGWTVRQTWFQRRANVATMIAATAAGTKAYRVLDVPADQAWAVAAEASPWVAGSVWGHS
jgi:putative membrane protein